VAGGFLTVSPDGTVFDLGPKAPLTDRVPPDDARRVEETLQALARVGEERLMIELEGIVHDTYELVP
jgi:hypothetical protein